MVIVEADTIDEDDFYWIDKKIFFSLPFFPDLITFNEHMEIIKIKCKEFNIILH
jgi:hypothetical protein